MTLRRRWIAPVVVASIALSGCLEFESTFEISDDGTVDVGIVTAVDTAQLEQLGSLFGDDASDLTGDEILGDDDPCGDLTAGLTGFEVTTTEINEDGRVGVGCTVTGVPVAELTDLGDDSVLAITQDDDGTTFELSLSGVSELTGGDGGDLDALGFSFEELLDFRFVVSAPGSLGENNATSTDGSTATWVLTPDAEFLSGDTATMSAVWTGTGSGDGGSSSAVLIIIIVLAVIAVAAIAFFLIKRQTGGDGGNGSAEADMPAPAATGAPMNPPTTAPPPPTAAPPSASTPPPPPPTDAGPPPPPPSS